MSSKQVANGLILATFLASGQPIWASEAPLRFILSQEDGRNAYEILGVNPSADSKALDYARRKRLFQWHPDRHDNSDKANRETRLILEAYAILKDEELRAKYDLLGQIRNSSPAAGTSSPGQTSEKTKPASPQVSEAYLRDQRPMSWMDSIIEPLFQYFDELNRDRFDLNDEVRLLEILIPDRLLNADETREYLQALLAAFEVLTFEATDKSDLEAHRVRIGSRLVDTMLKVDPKVTFQLLHETRRKLKQLDVPFDPAQMRLLQYISLMIDGAHYTANGTIEGSPDTCGRIFQTKL